MSWAQAEGSALGAVGIFTSLPNTEPRLWGGEGNRAGLCVLHPSLDRSIPSWISPQLKPFISETKREVKISD